MSAYDMTPCTHRTHIDLDNCYYAHRRLNLEAKIVRHMIRTLKAGGYYPLFTLTGDERESTTTETEMMNAIFSVDESRCTFTNGTSRHFVYIVLGNGHDVICDYSAVDPFATLMDIIVRTTSDKYQEVTY